MLCNSVITEEDMAKRVFEFVHVNMSMHWLHTLAVGCHEY